MSESPAVVFARKLLERYYSFFDTKNLNLAQHYVREGRVPLTPCLIGNRPLTVDQ